MVPSITEMVVPSTTEVVVPFTIEMVVPSTTEMMIPSTTEMVVPSTTEMVVSSTTGIVSLLGSNPQLRSNCLNRVCKAFGRTISSICYKQGCNRSRIMSQKRRGGAVFVIDYSESRFCIRSRQQRD